MADFDHPDQVSVTIRPTGGDDHSIAAADFIKQIDALRQLLTLSDRRTNVDARIVKMHMNSPATVVMEPVRDDGMLGASLRFFTDIEAVVLGGHAPASFDRPVFDALREFAAVVGKSVRSATIQVAGKSILIDVAARKRIEGVFGPDTSSEGTVDGMLEAVNVHGKKNTFGLYPIVGANRISCKFDERLLPCVRPALGKYVQIEGELKYRWREKFPYEAMATKIDVLDDWEDQPSFTEILGIAPDATGGVACEEFVRKVRHGWE
jgi:hypothetical protein